VITRVPDAARTACPAGSSRVGVAQPQELGGLAERSHELPVRIGEGTPCCLGRRVEPRRRGSLELLGSAVGVAAAYGLGTEDAFAFGATALRVLALDRFEKVGDPLADLLGGEALPARESRQGDELLLGEVLQRDARATATGFAEGRPVVPDAFQRLALEESAG